MYFYKYPEGILDEDSDFLGGLGVRIMRQESMLKQGYGCEGALITLSLIMGR